MRALLFACAGVLLAAQAPSSPGVETIMIDTSAPARPFPHFWEQMFGSGRATLSLREDWRNDLRAVKRVSDVQYIRFHGIFDDDAGVYKEDAHGRPVYNFSYVDRIYDGLLANGVRPFVELSFMPKALSATDHLHAFWYKPYPNPPKDYKRWDDLIQAFVKHLQGRYGNAEVEKWYFEVWNEPNIDFWTGEPKDTTYYELYDQTVDAVKAVNPKLRVGGPATSAAAWIEPFLAHCTEKHVPVDFVSTHVYGNNSSEDVFGKPGKLDRLHMTARAVRMVHDQVKRSAFPNAPIIWSEYNATYMNEVKVTDSPYMGPWLANNIRECDGLTAMMSYWTFSDVFEEQGVVERPFYGGYGLMAEDNVPKAAYNDFALLHRLGMKRIPNNSTDVLVTKRENGSLALALWNYADPDTSGSPRRFHLVFRGMASPHLRVQVVDREHGSALTAWEAMGRPDFPSRDQEAKLREAARLPSARTTSDATLRLEPNALALVEVLP
ncbi:MAG TPA: hypothetical protein VN610_04490 [Bryobacteraceae bacterium]|nr:hypothetical protein [Bryobacteraceae bacterium]